MDGQIAPSSTATSRHGEVRDRRGAHISNMENPRQLKDAARFFLTRPH
jgi:hypothetical protein